MDKFQTAMKRFKQSAPHTENIHSPGNEDAPSSMPHIIYTETRSVSIPISRLREQRILAGFEDGPFLESYKVLRTQVLYRLRENGWNVLGITSPREQEGKTLTAINLAISMAMDMTQTVLLVDSDLRHPTIHEAFGFQPEHGLSDYLLHHVPIKECLVHPSIGRFIVLPGGARVSGATEFLTSPKMVSLVNEFKHRYASRMVVFDIPPVLTSADTLAFAPFMDAILLVIEEGKTQREDLQQSLQLLKGTAPILGTVLNKSGGLTLSSKTAKKMWASSPSPKADPSQDRSSSLEVQYGKKSSHPSGAVRKFK